MRQTRAAILAGAFGLRGFREHLSVYEAVIARDGELAEERMKKHILRTLDFILKEKK